MNVNILIFAGRLTRDPQLKYLPNQTACCEIGAACNRRWKTQQGEEREETTFLDAVAFGKTAEVINQHFRKGKEIYLAGRLKTDSWEDKQTGQKRSKLTMIVDSFQFIGPPDGQQQQQGSGGASEPKDAADDDVPW